MKKALVGAVLLACAGMLAYLGYSLYHESIDTLPATVLIVAASLLLSWSFSRLTARTSRAGYRSILAMLVLAVLFGGASAAFGGYEPLASIRETVTGTITTSLTDEPLEASSSTSFPVKDEGDRYCEKSYTVDGVEIFSREAIKPPISKWNYEIRFPVAAFLADWYELRPSSILIRDYYSLTGGCWQHYTGEMDFPFQAFGGEPMIKHAPDIEIRY